VSKRDTWNKCAECGQFVGYEDIAEGRATVTLVTPDSAWSDERLEVLCRKHAHAEASR